jgi:hypothetical protein
MFLIMSIGGANKIRVGSTAVLVFLKEKENEFSMRRAVLITLGGLTLHLGSGL